MLRTRLFLYAFAALPLAFAGLPVYVHAPDFYARYFGVSLAYLGSALLVLRLIDAIQDPWIGSISDRYVHYRREILLIGAILLGGGFMMVFHPYANAPLLWFTLSIFVCTTGFSIVSINIQALGGLWHATPNERTRITSWREGLGLMGLLLASILPTLLQQKYGAITAFRILTFVYLPLLLLGGFCLYAWMKKAVLDDNPNVALGSWQDCFSDAWRRRFWILFGISNLASSIPAVLVMFFINDRLQAADQAGIFLLLYFLSGAFSMPLWQKVAQKVGKSKAWCISMILAIVTFLGAFTLGAGDVTGYAVICILSGMALGADLAIPPALLADHIADKNHQHRATRYFAITTFLGKAALALATGLTLPLLSYLGYQPGQLLTPSVGLSLSIIYALIPCIIKGMAAVWLWKKPL